MMPGIGSGLRVLHAMIMAFVSFKAFHTKAPFIAGIYISSLLFVKVVAKYFAATKILTVLFKNDKID